jgi:hypothetical protein
MTIDAIFQEYQFNEELRIEVETNKQILEILCDLIYFLAKRYGSIDVSNRYYNCFELDEYMLDFTKTYTKYGDISLKEVTNNEEILKMILDDLL